jgi:PAS domain S-box-containing protein
VRTEYASSLVVLSYVVASIASYVTLSLAARLQDAHVRGTVAWVAGGALAMGTGIWSMHFVGMLALRLPITVFYELPLTAASYAIAVAVSGFALQVFRKGAKSLRGLLLPGVIMGAGIAAMHYTGMAALRLAPAIEYDPWLFALSILIAVGASIAALSIAFNLNRITQRAAGIARCGAALVMGAAIVGMHYTGMAAANFPADAICVSSGLQLDEGRMAWTIGAFTIMLLTGTALASILDARLSSQLARSAAQLKRANEELEQRVAERTRWLAREEARKGAIVQAALDCVITVNRAGLITAFNVAAESTFGVPSEHAIGMPLTELIPPQALGGSGDAPKVFGNWLHGQSRGLAGQRFELTARRPDGTEFPVEVALAAVVAPDDEFYAMFVRDITERKEVEQQLRGAKEAAEAGSRAKSAFLAAVSHEIRTPMHAVMGMLEMLALTQLDRRQTEMLKVVREASDALLTLIDDILDFSKIEAGKLELQIKPCALPTLVGSVVNAFKGMASGKGLLLWHTLDPRLAAYHQADGARLRQILSNFLGNALKFTEAGKVSLHVDVIAGGAGRQTVRFEVRDTGIGIDRETLPRLFQPFEQGGLVTQRRGTAKSFGGTGLGLVICRRLADAMGGNIELESEPGRGTTISLTLDLEEAEPTAAATPGAAAAPAPPAPDSAADLPSAGGDAPVVLVVDDHPTNLRLLQEQLRLLGLRSEVATNGIDGLALFERGGINLVITDVQMPGMDGDELARRIRAFEGERGGRTPIVAFTANTQREAIEACYQAGMNDALIKPASLESLHDCLARWLPLPSSSALLAGERAVPGAPVARFRLDLLLQAAGGDRTQIAAVVAEFVESAQQELRTLRDAARDDDATALARAAHRIKGSARLIGAEPVSRCAAEVESLALDGGRSGGRTNDAIAALEHEVRALADDLGQLQAQGLPEFGHAAV